MGKLPMSGLDNFKNFCALLALIFGIFGFTAQAGLIYSQDEFKIELSGYLQTQGIHAEEFFQEPFDLGQSRLRLSLDAALPNRVKIELSQNLETSYGGALHNSVYQFAQDLKPATYFQWHKRLIEEEDFWLDWEIYRAYLSFENEKIKFILGRQRIALGNAFFYSPLDIFNPQNPISLEPEERLGVDGASLEFNLAPNRDLIFGYGLGEVIDESRFALYYKFLVNSYDIGVLSARIYQDWVFGASFFGYIKEGGFYGEATYTLPEPGENYFRATIGYQYAFSNSWILILEYYHNDGVLQSTPEDMELLLLNQDGLITMNRNFLGVSAGAEITPLLRFNSGIIYDIDGSSFFIAPSIIYSAPYSITLQAGMQLFAGDGEGEFSWLPNLLWARIRWDF